MHALATPVKTGLDVLRDQDFACLADLRLGLIANHTAIDREGDHLLDLLLRHGRQVTTIFSPEHGFQGRLDRPVASGVHEPTGIPIHSLYGGAQEPTPEMLAEVEGLVYDIADVGVRFYTYTTTMTHCMAAAAEAGLPMWVLDRPNPIRGDVVEGPILDRPCQSLSAWHALPLRHGFTSGELAKWANRHFSVPCDLRVVACAGWRRDSWLDETGLPWINPSPNLRSLREAVLYPAIGTLEATNISVGRGTDRPFEVIGAPWLEAEALARALDRAGLEQLSVAPVHFTPVEREFAGETCHGVALKVGDRNTFRPVTAAVQIALVLRQFWPGTFDYRKLRHLLGSEQAVAAIGEGRPAEEIVAGWQEELAAFEPERQSCLTTQEDLIETDILPQGTPGCRPPGHSER